MMVDLKPEILLAMRNSAVLSTILGRDKNGRVKVYPETVPEYDKAPITEPYITFFELTNFDDFFTDDQAEGSEIHFQIDIWTKGNTSPLAKEVDRVMKELEFSRTGSGDLYENDTQTYHKALRYKTFRMIEE
ncbi:tail completion protein gp17 [Brevibacillus borstelensis]|uniref:tail completion protein gp17 n=1 Tax=Brevibacillus borstelensis TaxID=45462 RepID=UPI0030BAD5CD